MANRVTATAVPNNYLLEANDALYAQLGDALGVAHGTEPDWDRVEAITNALHDLAQTFTHPKGANA